MKQITNKEYEEWQKYKAEKAPPSRCGSEAFLCFGDIYYSFIWKSVHSLSIDKNTPI